MAFKNYVYDYDLKKFWPLILQDLYNTQTDFSPQIELAGQLVVIDLQSKDIDTRLICVPNDLQTPYDTTTTNAPLTYTDISSSLSVADTDTGTAQYGFNTYKRFGVDLSSFNRSGSVTFTLQGTNELNYSDIAESDWTTITSIPVTASNATGEYVTTFEKEWRWVRYTAQAQDGAQCRYAVWTNDTTIDQFVVAKTLIIILTDMIERENDMWFIRRDYFQKMYDNLLGSAKYLIDSDDSGKPTDTDEEVSTGTLKFF